MYPVSDAFREAMRRPHTMATLAEVLDPNYVPIYTLKPIQGNVSVDRESDVRRSATVGLVDPTGELTPNEATDLLHPVASNKLRLWRGAVINGEPELVSLGIFELFDVELSDTKEELKINIQAFDTSKRVQRARLDRNYTVSAGTPYDQAIRTLLSTQVPTLSFNFPEVEWVTPDLVFGSLGDQAGGDPWKYAQEMADAIAHDLFFDIQDVLQLVPKPNTDEDDPVWEYKEGEDGTLIYLNKRLRKEETYNHVYAYGDNTKFDNPIKAEAMDEDPNSPTYVHGPYGDVPTFITSEYITTEEQAQAVADAKLREVMSTAVSMHMIATPMPAHEAGDVITVKRQRSKVDGNFVLQKFNINFDAWQAMNLNLREVRV